MKWGLPDAPRWTIEQAMQVLRAVAEPFREKGYGIAMHGFVPKQSEGNDLDLVAIPNELAVPPPEEMEQVMCELLDAQPLAEEPRADGLLRTWCRACILSDGRRIDVEYLRPGTTKLRKQDYFFTCQRILEERLFR